VGSSLQPTLIVIPAFNEEESIGSVLDEVRRHLPDTDIVVVSDGSSDGTASIVRQSGFRVVELPLNLGVGGAMRTGFKFALRNGYRSVIQLDADGQHDPAMVPRLVKELSEADIVIGSRFAGSGDYKVRGPRKWAMGFLSWSLSKICHTPLTDTTSGFKALNLRALQVFENNYPAEYLGDTVEALVIAARAKLVVRETPVTMRKRLAGQPSHNGLRSMIQLARALMALFFGLMRPIDTTRGT